MKYITMLLTLVTLSACAATWGAAHKVKFADENTFVIQYDTGLTSTSRATRLATEHCAKHNRKAVPVDAGMPGRLFGIIEETYDCS